MARDQPAYFISRRSFCWTLAGLLAVPGMAIAQTSHVRIGLLRNGDRASGEPYIAVFKQELSKFGYVEDQNLTLELRFADGKAELLPAFAEELLRLGVNIIVVADTPAALASQKATRSIPIVFATAADPVGNGLVASLAHPGGNITGLSNITSDISAKHVELLAAAIQRLPLLATMINPQNPSHRLIVTSVQAACAQRGIRNRVFEADTAEKITIAFQAMNEGGAKGVIVAIDSFFSQLRSQIIGLALKYKLPAIAAAPSWADRGLLMSYGQDIAENWRRAAVYCDKILRGAKPGDLPVEQSTKLEFVVNLKAANTIGLSIPETLLLRANRIIRE